MKDSKGFSMLELMVTIAIVAIVSAIAIPSFIKWLPDYRLRGAATDLFSNMQWARMYAIKQNKSCAVFFSVANNQYYIGTDSGVTGDWTQVVVTNPPKLVQLGSYNSGVQFGKGNATAPVGGGSFGNMVSYLYTSPTTGATATILVFDSRGLANAGWVYLTNDQGDAYAVGTQTSGVVMLQKYLGGQWQ